MQSKQTERRYNHLEKINVYYLVNLKGIHKSRFIEHIKVGQSFFSYLFLLLCIVCILLRRCRFIATFDRLYTRECVLAGINY